MTIIVREAVSGDKPALREMFLRSRRETFVWQSGDAFELADFDAQTDGELLLVAEAGSARLTGFISVWEPDNFIHHLHVERRDFRRGIGRALLFALPGWPMTRDSLKCLRANKPALAFYYACGFIESGTGTADDADYLLLETRGEVGQ
jgi:ribosomal protein S18 acetylase RimI-like enzyme